MTLVLRILITGSKGQLGQEFNRLKSSSKHNLFTDLNQLNICSVFISSYLKEKIDCIINCAAYTDVRKAEIERDKALNVNSIGVKNLVTCCEENNIKLIHFSTDYVYNSNSKPIKEEEFIAPQNYYGFQKEGEKYIENSKMNLLLLEPHGYIKIW